MPSTSTLPSLIIVAIGQDSLSPPSLSATTVPSDFNPSTLRSWITQGTFRHRWKEHVVSDISQLLFRLDSTQSLLVRVLTIEAWWDTQIQKQLMELSISDPPLNQVRTNIVLWSLLFPEPSYLVAFCHAFTQLGSVQLVGVRWEHPWLPQQLRYSAIRRPISLPNELHILGSALMSVCLSKPLSFVEHRR